MKVDEERHANINLTDTEITKLEEVSNLLEDLCRAIDKLENENVDWDICSILDESQFWDMISDIRFLSSQLMGE